MTDPQNTNFKLDTYKLTVFGEPGVGKTSFLKRYLQGTFSERSDGKVILDFGIKLLKDYKGNSGVNYKLHIWDLSSN